MEHAAAARRPLTGESSRSDADGLDRAIGPPVCFWIGAGCRCNGAPAQVARRDWGAPSPGVITPLNSPFGGRRRAPAQRGASHNPLAPCRHAHPPHPPQDSPPAAWDAPPAPT
eukprot:scaffold2838_cov376-Prasinococcus_capsulatus_cf.AAC.7